MTELKTIVAGNEAGLRVLFECVALGILVTNRNEKFALINSCTQNLFRCSQEELIGKPLETPLTQASINIPALYSQFTYHKLLL